MKTMRIAQVFQGVTRKRRVWARETASPLGPWVHLGQVVSITSSTMVRTTARNRSGRACEMNGAPKAMALPCAEEGLSRLGRDGVAQSRGCEYSFGGDGGDVTKVDHGVLTELVGHEVEHPQEQIGSGDVERSSRLDEARFTPLRWRENDREV